MRKVPKLVLRWTPVDIPPTPKQTVQREKFTRAAREVAQEMKDTKLRGAARVRAYNAHVAQKLREPNSQAPV